MQVGRAPEWLWRLVRDWYSQNPAAVDVQSLCGLRRPKLSDNSNTLKYPQIPSNTFKYLQIKSILIDIS